MSVSTVDGDKWEIEVDRCNLEVGKVKINKVFLRVYQWSAWLPSHVVFLSFGPSTL